MSENRTVASAILPVSLPASASSSAAAAVAAGDSLAEFLRQKVLLRDQPRSQRLGQVFEFLQPAGHRFHQLVSGERFREVVVGSEIHAAPGTRSVVECGKEDKRNFGKTRLGPQGLEHGETVHLRHHHVAQDEIGRIAARQLQAHAAVFRSGRGVALDLQHQHDVVADAGLVLDDEDFLCGLVGHQCTPTGCLTVRKGSITVNRVPEPTALDRLISPPWSSTDFFTIARPRPVPGRFSTFEAR